MSELTMVVNGQARAYPFGATVAMVIEELLESDAGCAVALNGTVVPRSQWRATRLSAGDQLEVLSAAAGG